MTVVATDPVVGLTSAEVAERVARGQVNAAPDARSRSLGDIVRANTFTWFNGLIGTLWVIMLVVAPIQDSLFGFVIVANTAIGIIQEYRAARTLAKLAVLGEARPLVRRDGADVEVSPHDVVLDDLVVLRTGDQLVVDGVIVACDGLEIDECLLTGEADPVDKAVGDDAMSGSFVVAGSGTYQATRVGRDSFAAGLTEEAKKFHLTNSELRDAINGFIRGISFLLLPVGLLLLWSQVVRADLPLDEAIRGTIAGRRHDGPRGPGPADEHRDGRLGDPAGAEEGPRPGHARRRGAGPRRHDLRRQDRHPDRAGHARARRGPARRRGARPRRRARAPWARARTAPTRRWPRSPSTTPRPAGR